MRYRDQDSVPAPADVETSAPLPAPPRATVTRPLVDTYLEVIGRRIERYRADGDGARTTALEALLAELKAL